EESPRPTPPHRGEESLRARSSSEGSVDSSRATADALAGASGSYGPDVTATRTAEDDGRVGPVVFGDECPNERALFSQVTPTAAAQVAMPQEKVATRLADEIAPDEIGSGAAERPAAGARADEPEPPEWLQAHLESRRRLLWGPIAAAAGPAARDPGGLPG